MKRKKNGGIEMGPLYSIRKAAQPTFLKGVNIDSAVDNWFLLQGKQKHCAAAEPEWSMCTDYADGR